MNVEDVEYIIIHCSATPPDMDIGSCEIDRWHRQRGWLGIGYHWVIRRDGTLEQGRKEDVAGAHTHGYNLKSIGVCLVGGINNNEDKEPEDNFTEDQKDMLLFLLGQLTERYPDAKVIGHNKVNKHKACPSFDVDAWLKDVGLHI